MLNVPLSSGVYLPAGILPHNWCRYTVPASMTVIQWVADFSERIKQLQQISQAAASGGAKELKVNQPVQRVRRGRFSKLFVTANHTDTWWYNMGLLNL